MKAQYEENTCSFIETFTWLGNLSGSFSVHVNFGKEKQKTSVVAIFLYDGFHPRNLISQRFNPAVVFISIKHAYLFSLFLAPVQTCVITRELVSSLSCFLLFSSYIYTTLRKTSHSTNVLFLHNFHTLYNRKEHPVEQYFCVKGSLDGLNKKEKNTSQAHLSFTRQNRSNKIILPTEIGAAVDAHSDSCATN